MVLRLTWKVVVKWIWIGLSVSVLELGLGACFADYYYDQVPWQFLTFMVLLSFPMSMLALPMILPMTMSYSGVEYTGLWFLLFLAGYIQWFVLLPKLNEPHLVILNLASARGRKRPFLQIPERKSIRPRKPRTPAWDEAGLTPLERVINRR